MQGRKGPCLFFSLHPAVPTTHDFIGIKYFPSILSLPEQRPTLHQHAMIGCFPVSLTTLVTPLCIFSRFTFFLFLRWENTLTPIQLPHALLDFYWLLSCPSCSFLFVRLTSHNHSHSCMETSPSLPLSLFPCSEPFPVLLSYFNGLTL